MLFKKNKIKTCECCGFEIKEGKLPSKKTYNRIEVCPNAALKSSLNQMGNGIKLDPKVAKELKKKLKEIL